MYRLLFLFGVSLLMVMPASAQLDEDDPTVSPFEFETVSFLFDSTVFGNPFGEIIPAQSLERDDLNLAWAALPQRTRISFQDDNVPGVTLSPTIDVFSTQRLQEGLAPEFAQAQYNRLDVLLAAGEDADLTAYTDFQQEPLLSLANAVPQFALEPAIVAGDNVVGLRYVTLLDANAYLPGIEPTLIYVFDGLTRDRSHYVTAYFALMNDSAFDPTQADDPSRLDDANYTPALDDLDAMLATLTVSGAAPAPADATPGIDYGVDLPATATYANGVTFAVDYDPVYFDAPENRQIDDTADLLYEIVFNENIAAPENINTPVVSMFSTAGLADDDENYTALRRFIADYLLTETDNVPPPPLPSFTNVELPSFGLLPYLPEGPFVPVFSVQPAYVAGPEVVGISYISLLAEGPFAVDNQQLAYVFQGLTRDAAYYISIVLPLQSAVLPASSDFESEAFEAIEAINNNRIIAVTQADLDAFQPSLMVYDAIAASFRVE
jgi:hypothetical protein